ncbi:hypothetical protein [Saccharopolyspora griseoalba]|uniref:Uncharacterized protein n=1 Tax=Saccharopolyspora griseoalba TaxID=1431848 RepID=A0ABW2LGL7_9PSEU
MRRSAEIRPIQVGCRGLARQLVLHRELLGFEPVRRPPRVGAANLRLAADGVGAGPLGPARTVVSAR